MKITSQRAVVTHYSLQGAQLDSSSGCKTGEGWTDHSDPMKQPENLGRDSGKETGLPAELSGEV